MLERIKLYSQLMRMDKPIGFFLLMWPVLWAFIISSEGSPNIFFLIIFAVGIIATRSAGCIINDYFDQLLVRPTALTYTNYTPRILRVGVGNFFDNLQDVNVTINDFLQLKIEEGFSDTGRVIVNSTIGLGGLIDVASDLGLDRNEEDFGQTLGAWGIVPGPYLFLPIFGASNLEIQLGSLLVQYLTQLDI